MLLMFVVLVPFFFAKGLIEILGKDEIKRLLLKARTEAQPANRSDGQSGHPTIPTEKHRTY